MLRRQPAPSDPATPNAPNAPESQAETAETGATPIHASRVSVASPHTFWCRGGAPAPTGGGVDFFHKAAGWGRRAPPCAAPGGRPTPYNFGGGTRHQRVRFVFYDSES